MNDFRPSFQNFLSQLKDTNATLEYFSDFKKICGNVSCISLKLKMLNHLIGKADIIKAVHEIWSMNPAAFSVLNFLVAVRDADTTKVLDSDGQIRTLSDFFQTPDNVLAYLNGTGLSSFLQAGHVKDLEDFVFGIETGLDSNARKNRGGSLMENRVQQMIQNAGLDVEAQVGVDRFNIVANQMGTDFKKFDFVIRTAATTYLLEVNFYSGGGSKLNETARSYTEIGPKINACNGFQFVWVTDGVGWLSAKNKLEEAYNTIPHIYNLTTFPGFLTQLKACRTKLCS